MIQHHYYYPSKPCYDDLAPSYATFWQDEFITIPLNEPFFFKFTGPTTPDIYLLDPSTIKVSKAGVYQVNYQVLLNVDANTNPSTLVSQRISLYVNGIQQPNSQTSFGIELIETQACFPISGNFIVEIPADANLQLKNDGIYTGSSPITTCDNGVNSVSFSIIRID
ncbi:hypothetical protein [Clostridium sp. B9]|uniref:hypothetical protein n=1 Tax=Clostridium sp. B9 TaxID=3423224 RepID=UPI003D2F0CA3